VLVDTPCAILRVRERRRKAKANETRGSARRTIPGEPSPVRGQVRRQNSAFSPHRSRRSLLGQRDGVFSNNTSLPFALAARADERDDPPGWLCRLEGVAVSLREQTAPPAAFIGRTVNGVIGQHARNLHADGRVMCKGHPIPVQNEKQQPTVRNLRFARLLFFSSLSSLSPFPLFPHSSPLSADPIVTPGKRCTTGRCDSRWPAGIRPFFPPARRPGPPNDRPPDPHAVARSCPAGAFPFTGIPFHDRLHAGAGRS
jgi:hypothetical protein